MPKLNEGDLVEQEFTLSIKFRVESTYGLTQRYKAKDLKEMIQADGVKVVVKEVKVPA